MPIVRCPFMPLLCMTLIVTLSAQAMAQPPLTVSNQTHDDLLSIRFTQGRETHFARIDLEPGAEDDLENSGKPADLRLDFGLALWFFNAVPLAKTRRMTACNEHTACLILVDAAKASRHLRGTAQSLLPAENAPPVCVLDKFRPGMPMSEACGLIAPDSPRDDNEAYLTSLGFAGLVWAARLSPGQPGGSTPQKNTDLAPDILSHLELRRPLVEKDLDALLAALYAMHYSPWQAELPGIDMNFTRIAELSQVQQQEMLRRTLAYFLQSSKGEATIMLAPTQLLPALADADAPRKDVQLFTLTLRHASKSLIVDVSAYSGNEGGR